MTERGLERMERSWPWRARAVFAALAVLGAGCARQCGGATGAGPLSKEEARAIPGVVAFLSERAGQKDVWLVSPDGTETQLTRGADDDYPGPPSPDGKQLLVIAAAEVGGLHFQQLRVLPLDGGEAVALHAPRARSRNPSWAPDGSWLVTESDARGFSDVVRLQPRADTAEVPLTQVREGCFEPAVSPDGQEVAYVCSREGDPEIYVARADGTQERRLTFFHKEDRTPVWSPSGKWLVFVSDREARGERLFLVRPDGSDLRPVSGEAFAGDEREAAFSPDGQKLAWVARLPEGKSRIFVAPVEGGAPVALTDGKQRDDMPAWSPDGKYLAFVSEREGETDVYLMRADGTGQTRLTTAKGPDWLPRWVARR